MTEPLEHPPGTPSWADLTASDPEAAISFYGGPLGWEAVAVEGPEAAGGYRLLTLGGRRAAGVLGSDRPSA